MSAWIYQDPKQVEKHGEGASAWSVGWYDPEGKRRCKSCGPGSEGKRNAEKLRKKIEAELLTGTYQSNIRKTWDQFRQEWDQKIGSKMPSQTKRLTLEALVHFERVVKPARIAAIKTQMSTLPSGGKKRAARTVSYRRRRSIRSYGTCGPYSTLRRIGDT